MISRGWHAIVATLVMVGLTLQVVITAHAPALPPAHVVGTLAGAPLATRLVRVLSFFTVQSNILCALASARGVHRSTDDGAAGRTLRLAALVGISVTGIVYSTVLARIHEPRGWEQVTTNAIFHYIVPVMMVLGWVLFGPRGRIDLAMILRAALWPAAWFAYTLIHGAISGWYPYPFVDAATHGYGKVLLNVVAVLAVLAATAGIFVLIERRFERASAAR